VSNNVDHPVHYSGRDGVNFECIDLTEWQTFSAGNAIKYLWRFRIKGKPLEDLQKARWYARRASMLGQGVAQANINCVDILKMLIAHTTGFERVAWEALKANDWHRYIEALDRMIERLENGEEA
jgi:hypothetical protein